MSSAHHPGPATTAAAVRKPTIAGSEWIATILAGQSAQPCSAGSKKIAGSRPREHDRREVGQDDGDRAEPVKARAVIPQERVPDQRRADGREQQASGEHHAASTDALFHSGANHATPLRVNRIR